MAFKNPPPRFSVVDSPWKFVNMTKILEYGSGELVDLNGWSKLQSFSNKAREAPDAEALYATFLHAITNLDYPLIMYGALRNHPEMGKPWIKSTYPMEWLDHYVARGYALTDPTRTFLISSARPFTWAGLINRLDGAGRVIFDEAARFGLHSGITVPVHGPRGECVGIGLASPCPGLDSPEMVDLLGQICYQFHTLYRTLAGHDANDMPRLTPREIEILLWCRNGARNQQIAEQLCISLNSVEWHVRNIFDKLGVSNRTSAVVRAIQFNLIV